MQTIIKIILLLCVTSLSAQQGVSGTITENNSPSPISYVDVLLFEGESKSISQAVITNDKGEFVLENLSDSIHYTLKTHYLGYMEFSLTFQLKPEEKKTIHIQLEKSSSELDEVVIIAEKTTIEHKPDRKIINLGNDILAISASAGDILQELPSVSVSETGNVSLRGNQNTTILVNGKKSSLSNDKLISQLPSESILKIEIITNPSAKYQAEGLSGIINIITKKNRKIGGNINLSSGIGTGRFKRSHTDFGINYGTQKIKASIEYNYNERYWDHFTTRNEERQNKIFTSESDNYRINKTPYYLKAGLDIFIDSTNTLSFTTAFSKNKAYYNNEINSIETGLNSLSESAVLTRTNTVDVDTNSDYNINYRKEFDGSFQYIEADANYSKNPSDYISNRITETELLNDKIEKDIFLNDSRVSTISLDYYKRHKNSILEVGSRFEFKKLKVRTSSTPQLPNEPSNIDYAYNDKIYAGYGVYELSHKNFTYKGGLRIEHTKLYYKSPSDEFDKNYTDLFPSLSFSFKNKGHSFSLNYSRRISRPSVWALRSTITQNDNYTQRKGNPDINPEYANKMEFNYFKRFSKFSFSTSIFHLSVDDVIGHISTVEGDFLVSSMDNIGKSRDYGLELDTNLSLFKWWNANFSTYFYITNYKTTTFLNDQSFRQGYSINNTITLSKATRIQANGRYSPKSKRLQNTRDESYNVNIAVSQDFFKKKGKLILRVNDVFNSHRHGYVGSVNGFAIENKSYAPTARHIYLTFKYNLDFGGKGMKERKRKSRDYLKRS